jgi:hypothetical protein
LIVGLSGKALFLPFFQAVGCKAIDGNFCWFGTMEWVGEQEQDSRPIKGFEGRDIAFR